MPNYDTSYPPELWEPQPPTITSLNPSTGVTATPKTITITGTNFVAGCTARMGATAMTTTFVNATTLTASIASLPATGTVQVTVTTPAGTSNQSPFVITATELAEEPAP